MYIVHSFTCMCCLNDNINQRNLVLSSICIECSVMYAKVFNFDMLLSINNVFDVFERICGC